MGEWTGELRVALQKIDTPTLCNALEVVAPKRRGYGYTTKPLVCCRPQLPPLVGVARTATIRSAHPSDLRGDDARKLSDGYYEYIDRGPKPSVVVIQDLDTDRGYGCFWGEVNSSIHLGFGCLGVITDGAVRDLPDIAEGFQMLAGSVVPSHAFVHVVDYSRPVTVAGMRVRDGDWIHADQHGAVVVPHEVAADLPAAANLIGRREKVIIEAARQPGFDIEKLRQAQGDAAEIH
jgi:regulator of RNase E activity RraA